MGMGEKKSMLCVGGPRAGQRYASATGAGFAVPTSVYSPEDDPYSEDWKPNKSVTVENHFYRREVFHTPQGDVSFWAVSTQTPLQSIEILLETYERTLAAAEALLDKIAHVNGIESERAALIAACVKAHGGGG